LVVDGLEAMDQIDDTRARSGAAGGRTEVSATPEGAVLVDQAARGFRMEEGAGPVGSFRQFSSPGGPEGLGRDERFALGEVGRQAGDFEVATLGPQGAVAGQRALGQFLVNGANLLQFRGGPSASISTICHDSI